MDKSFEEIMMKKHDSELSELGKKQTNLSSQRLITPISVRVIRDARLKHFVFVSAFSDVNSLCLVR